MVDVNTAVRTVLNRVTDAAVRYFHPGEFNALPVISYYELTSGEGLRCDNEEWAQAASVCVDIWGKSGAQCAEIAAKVNAEMQSEGWRRELSRDMPPEDGVYHKAMRYAKMIYFIKH